MKLDFEIAVDQKGGGHNRTFEGEGGFELPLPNGAHWVATNNIWPKISNLSNKVKTKQLGSLLVATGFLRTRVFFFLKLDKDG